MADYLIQDTTLDEIADAINAKTGGSSAMTPAEMVTAIESIQTGGGEWTTEGLFDGTEPRGRITVNNQNVARPHVLNGNTGVTTLFIKGDRGPAFSATFQSAQNLQIVVAPEWISKLDYNTFRDAPKLTVADLKVGALRLYDFYNCPLFNTLVIRNTSLLKLDNKNVFEKTPFYSGGTGGTIYILKSLYDHLGDGSALDYKAATNWSTIDGYGTITWAQIEGSQYEHYYADGTPIA